MSRNQILINFIGLCYRIINYRSKANSFQTQLYLHIHFPRDKERLNSWEIVTISKESALYKANKPETNSYSHANKHGELFSLTSRDFSFGSHLSQDSVAVKGTKTVNSCL
ncbi:hypothetical protein NPIL_506371 [Nephila pilipes]|uniref:Uncharacterized protein n=1 Tax=Nephila pilipes TaxID=299642 RepID=A0A8X6THA2_NEPPI|nr:hypothetical protein NPIL_506371 [Nephila pilipes]